jgi:hypothetical protein
VPRLRLILSTFAAAVFCCTLVAAQTTPYRFDLLAEASVDDGQISRAAMRPALNDNGTAAFILSSPPTGPIRRGFVHVGTPGNVREAATPDLDAVGGVSINCHDRVGFVSIPWGTSPGGSGNRLSVHAVTAGGPVITIVPRGAYGGEIARDTAISDGGAVMVITDALQSVQAVPNFVLVGDGTAPADEVFRSPTPSPGVFSGTLFGPRMNASGDWVVSDLGGDPRYRALRSNRGGFVSPPDSRFTRVSYADIADDGRVVLSASENDGPGRLYLLPGGPIGADGFAPVPGSDGIGGIVAINNKGAIASLMGNGLPTNPYRLLLYQGETFAPVLSQGGALLGSTVSSIDFDPEGFNNANQFALLVGLADGRDMFVLASPVPEPAALGMIALSGVFLLQRHRRPAL